MERMGGSEKKQYDVGFCSASEGTTARCSYPFTRDQDKGIEELTEKRKEELTRLANAKLIKAILPFIQDFEETINYAEKTGETLIMIKRLKFLLRCLFEKLNEFRVCAVESSATLFDTTFHKGRVIAKTDLCKPDQVRDEFQ